MKIVTDDRVYIQKKDIMELRCRNSEFARRGILFKIMEEKMEPLIISDDCSDEFMYFKSDELIEYFKDIDWLLDYNDVKDKSVEDLKKDIEDTKIEMKNTSLEFDKIYLSEDENLILTRNEILRSLDDTLDGLVYKITTLDDLIKYKLGKIVIPFPDELGIKKSNKKSLFKSLFSKNN